MTIASLLRSAADKLSSSPQPRMEAEILLCHTLEVSRSFLFANPELEIPLRRRNEFLRLLRRRTQGEPVAYLVGHREFWTLDLKVTPDVLIPRPETELLVEKALELVEISEATRIADLGTGSGAIALAIASERPGCEIHATDISTAALDIARSNAMEHEIDSVQFHHGSWLEPLQGKFRLILSNPPYVAERDTHLHTGDCRYEPELALSSGDDGLSSIRQICEAAPGYLEKGGWLIFEHGHEQGDSAREILSGYGFRKVETLKDLAGLDRVSLGLVR